MSKGKRQGFTIVELLIVIVVIGILAAIVIVAFNGVQNRSRDASVQSDLANARKKIEAERTLGASGNYGAAPWAANVGAAFGKDSYTTSNNNLLFCSATNGSEYALIAASKSNKRYYVTNNKNVTEFTGVWAGTGTTSCPAALENNTASGSFTWAWGYSSAAWNF